MPAVMQRSFAGGEVGPSLWARADQTKYQTGLRLCRNFLVQRFGGVTNRPGWEFVCEVADSTKPARLLPFVFNADQTYVLAFGDLTLRFIRAGAQIESAPDTPYEIVTTYDADDLATLNYVQSADVVTLAHHLYPVRELSRTGDAAWSIADMDLTPSQARPTGVAATAGTGGSKTFRYKVTAINKDYEESLAGLQTAKTITGATQADPCVITAVAHGYRNGDDVLIDGVVGMTELNGKVFRVDNKATDTFELLGIDSTAYGAYVSGGEAKRTSARITSSTPTSSDPNVIAWSVVAGAWRYNIYKEDAGIFGYIGTAEEATFDDTNITPATSYTPPDEQTVFGGPGDYPATVTYYQQRLAFANTLDEPEKIWLSRTGQFTNFTSSQPIQSDDAISFTMAGRQVNAVRHLVEIDTLLALTGAGEHIIQGDGDGVLRPTAINPKQQGYNGSADTPAPVVVNTSILYVQARGTIVRDLRFENEAGGYTGRDLTVFASHLFEGYSIVAWAFQQVPHSIVWAVRSDGVLLGLTYLREHEVWGWHRHDTGDGDTVEDVCTVPEGDEDAVYVLVRRLVNGTYRRYIERMASRRVTDVADAVFLDSALRYDGRHTGSTTMTLSGSGWTADDALTLTASAGQFIADDVGNSYVLTGTDGTIIWCEVLEFTSATVVSVRPDQPVPVSMQAMAIATWTRAVDEVAGLEHLEGRTVGILADGNVLPQQVVTGGAVTLGHAYSRIIVGLPYVSEIETLDLENPEATQVEKKKRINRVNLLVESSRGVFAGFDRDHLREYKQRSTEAWGEPIALHTGTVEIPLTSAWTPGGSIVVQQSDPLPLTILAVAPGGEIGG
jgi:hypothetical protein